MSNAEYQGAECQLQYTAPASMTLNVSQPKYNIIFQNTEGYELGRLDFSGPGLAFEGNAEEGAIALMTWVGQIFSGRLKEEYDRGLADGTASQSTW